MGKNELPNLKKKPDFFVYVPYAIVKYSCEYNHWVLPVYLYSWISAKNWEDNLVITSLDLIMRELNIPLEKKNLFVPKIKESFKVLQEGIDLEKEMFFDSCLEWKKGEELTNKSSNTPFCYYFYQKSIRMFNKFVMIDYKEISYIINNATQMSKGTLEQIELLNYYSYLKMKISAFENTGLDTHMKESIRTLAKNNGVSPTTIIKYNARLEELGLIKVLSDSSNRQNIQENKQDSVKKSNCYKLSANWKIK